MLNVYYFLCRFYAHMPFLALILLDMKGFSSGEIVRYFSIYPLTLFLCEIPTGIFADHFGEKASILIGETLKAVGLVLLFLLADKMLLLICQVFIGLGDSFISGALDSYAYQYYASRKDTLPQYKDFSTYISKLYTNNWLGITIACAFGSLVYFFRPLFVLFVPIVSTAICIILLLLLPKTVKRNRHAIIKLIPASIRYLSVDKKTFYWLLIGAFTSASIVVTYLMTKPLLNETAMANYSNGVVFAIVSGVGALGAKYQNRVAKLLKTDRGMFITLFGVLVVSCFFLSVVKTLLLFVITFTIFRFVMGMAGPYLSAKLNASITDDSIRSTLLSTSSLMSNFFQWAIFSVFSLSLFSGSGVTLQFVALSGLLMIVAMLVGFLLNKGKALAQWQHQTGPNIATAVVDCNSSED